MFFGGPPNKIQNIPQKWSNKNCAKWLPNFRDHLLRHPSARNYAAPSHQNIPLRIYYSTPPPKGPTKHCAKRLFRVFNHVLYFTPAKSNSQHNGHIHVSPTHALQSIKVTLRKWGRRTPKNE